MTASMLDSSHATSFRRSANREDMRAAEGATLPSIKHMSIWSYIQLGCMTAAVLYALYERVTKKTDERYEDDAKTDFRS